MKLLKALCAVITILISASISAPVTHTAPVFAETDSPVYAYADMENAAYFCSGKDEETVLFRIPKTYCVQVLGEEDGWYYCKYGEDDGVYKAVYGYCSADELTKTETPPENKYLRHTVTVVYKADQGNSLLPSLEIEMTAAFYGEYTLGKTTCSYVLCAGKFGYIPGKPDGYPLNDITSDKPVIAPVSDPPDTMLITASVIIAAALAAITVLYFTGRKKPKL